MLIRSDDATYLGSPASESFDVYIPLCAEARHALETLGLQSVLPGSLVGQERHEEACRRLEDEIDQVVAVVNEYFEHRPASVPNVGEYFRFVAYKHLSRYSAIAQILECAAQAYDVSYLERPLRAGTYLSEAFDVLAATRDGIRRIRTDVAKTGLPETEEPVAESPGEPWRRRLGLAGVNGLLWARAACRLGWSAPLHKAIVLNGFSQWVAIGLNWQFRPSVRLELKRVGAEEDTPAVGAETELAPRELVQRLSCVMGGRIPVGAIEDLCVRVAKFVSYVETNDTALEHEIADARIVVGSVFITPLGRYYCSKAIRRNKEVVIFQHGAMNLNPESKHLASVETDATQYLSWGSAVDRKREQLEGAGHLKNIWVVGAVRNKVKYRGGDTVVYATGKYFSNTVMIHYVDPDGRLYDAQKALLKFFDRQQQLRTGHVRFVVKANNTPGANEIPFETSVPVDARSRFVDLMAHAKAVVLDCPATTCVEAAATRVPLFVLMGRVRWYDEAIEKLAKRAVVCDSVDQLTSAVEDFLESGTYHADVGNTEFADAYFGVESVSTSVRKIAAVLSNVAAGTSHAR